MKRDELIFTIIAFIYFFVNGVFLPFSMLYTIFLTPFFYYYLLKQGNKNAIGYFIVACIPWAIGHSFNDLNVGFYIKSTVLIATVYLFVFAFHVYLKKGKGIEKLFARIALVNFVLTLVAIVLFWTDFKPDVWYLANLNTDIKKFPRLKLFTYEPSYYSTLLVPIVVFYFLSTLTKAYKIRTQIFMLFLISVPLLLSFSLGVLSSLVFAFVVCISYFFKPLFKNRITFYNIAGYGLIGVLVFSALFLFYPENPLFERVIGIFEGKDLSGKGRTTVALMLSWEMLDFCNTWMGCGQGQIKVIGEKVVRAYYNYQKDDIPIITIPSAIGETLSYFGVVGVLTRISILVYLYFKTKVYSNYYRFILFWYMFLYQFTGSFFTNIAEYVIWVFAFTPYFSQFNVPQKTKTA